MGNQCCVGGNFDEIYIGQIIVFKYKSIILLYKIVLFWCILLIYYVWLSYILVGFGEDVVEQKSIYDFVNFKKLLW